MLNKCILQGRLTADPSVTRTQSDVAVCSFSVAVDRAYKAGEDKVTDFIYCTAWRHTAEFVGKYFRKGSPIIVEGTLETRRYTGQDGIDRVITYINVDKAHFDGGKKAEAEEAPQQASPSATSQMPNFESIGNDDDLPF